MSGNLWMFSDMLDDENIEILKHEFITYYQGADYYGLGLKVFTRMAHEAGDVYKIGKKMLSRRIIFDEYLMQVYQKKSKPPVERVVCTTPIRGFTGLTPAAGVSKFLTTHYNLKQPLTRGCLFLLNYSCYP